MLSNLIANAIEASPPAKIVTIDLHKNRESIIAIHNAGSIPIEIRHRFFEKYATAGKPTGTGLGAYSALLMAKAHGGTIDMETSDEDGTRLRVHLPLQKDA
jgi:signal transduction histidine kinase